MGSYAAAAADFGRLIALGHGTVRAFNSRAYCHASLGEFDQAVADYTEAIRVRRGVRECKQSGPGATETHLRLLVPLPARLPAGCCAATLQRTLCSPAAAVQLDPGNVHAFFNRGISHEKRGDQRAAITDASACIRLDPGNAVAFYNRCVPAAPAAPAGDCQGWGQSAWGMVGMRGCEGQWKQGRWCAVPAALPDPAHTGRAPGAATAASCPAALCRAACYDAVGEFDKASRAGND